MTASPMVPEELCRGSFDRATLARHGIAAHHLRGGDWTRTNRGLWVYTPGGGLPTDPRRRILAAAPLTGRHGAIGGWAAGFVQGIESFDGVDAQGRPVPVPVCLPRDDRCRRTHGVRIVRSDLEPHEIVVQEGVRVTSPARTVADLARFTRPFTEAVVAVDAMVRNDDALLHDVRQWLTDHPRRRGVGQARRVLRWARSGAESPGETRLRLLWVLDAALPEPLANQWVYTRDGRLLGRADLLDPQAALVGEYDGRDHAEASRRSHDHFRREAFQRAGLIVVQHTSVDVGARRRACVDRLQQAHAAGRRRDQSRDDWMIGPAPHWARRYQAS